MKILKPEEFIKVAGYFTVTPDMSDEDIKKTVKRNSKIIRGMLFGVPMTIGGAVYGTTLKRLHPQLRKPIGAGLGLGLSIAYNKLAIDKFLEKSDEKAAKSFLKEFRKKNSRFKGRASNRT